MEKEIIAYIYERKKVKDDDGVQSYVYEAVRITKGMEYDYEGSKFFITDKDDYIPFIEDVYSLDRELVYAFPYPIDDLTKEQKEELFKKIRTSGKSANNYILFQIYIEGQDEITTFATPNENMTYINVDVADKDGLEKLKTVDPSELRELKTFTKTEPMFTGSEDSEETFTSPLPVIYTDTLYDEVSKTVICQDEQIKQIATAIAKNSRLVNPSLKSNLLICGPTGVGKTEIFRCISKCTSLPIAIEDSTEYTAASYKGKDVTEMLSHLLDNADGDLNMAQRGILIVDEIDKKVSGSGEHATYTSAVIQSLLKMMEGHTYIIQGKKGQDEIAFDTSNLTFAFLGAFSGIEEYMKTKRGIGFGSIEPQEEQDNKKKYNIETLKKYGMLPEFIGRNDCIVVMNSLDTENLMRIITESNKSQLLLYREFFRNIGIDFKYDEAVIRKIAEEAKQLGIGARGIKTIVENALEVANYYALSSQNFRELIITPETISDPYKYVLK